MKATGVIRKIDELGRIVIPKDLRKALDIYSVVDQAIHYFNYVRPVRKLNRKPPVQYRIELAA